jgi:hypothetical protein
VAVRVTSNEVCTVHWLIADFGDDPEPSATVLKEKSDTSYTQSNPRFGKEYMGTGTKRAEFSVGGLSASRKYNFWYVLEDQSGNFGDVQAKVVETDDMFPASSFSVKFN